jgi:very-short-patch-repair endonuclease
MTVLPFRGRRPGLAWTPVSHGLHRPSTLREDLSSWRLVLPASARFTHLTGAELRGWWLPPLPAGLPVFVAMLETETRPQRHGLHVTRHRSLAEPTTHLDLCVDTPAECLLRCARHLSLLDLVVLCDAALYAEDCTVDDIAAAAAARRRGAPLLRRAVPLLDGRSESAWETVLRLLHVSSGIAVEPQKKLYGPDGDLVARADLWLSGTKFLHEYDGDEHLPRARQRKDLARQRRLDEHGFVRHGYTAPDVLHQAVGILRDADRAVGRPHRPERIRQFHAMLAESCFTASGLRRLQHRLNLTAWREDAYRDRSGS